MTHHTPNTTRESQHTFRIELEKARASEFATDDERALWSNAHHKLRRRLAVPRGDGVREVVMDTPLLSEYPLAVKISGSDGSEGLYAVGRSQPPTVHAPRILLVGRHRWTIATTAVLLQQLGCIVTCQTDPTRAASLAAPWHRSRELPQLFDFILVDHDHHQRGGGEPPSPTAPFPQRRPNDDEAPRRNADALLPAVGGRDNTATARKPGAGLDLRAMLRAEQQRKLDPDMRRGGTLPVRQVRPSTELSDLCQNIRASDEEFAKRTNHIVYHPIIVLIGSTTTGAEVMAAEADLFLRRPLAAVHHLQTLRRLVLPSHLASRLRCSLAQRPTGFQKVLQLFRTTTTSPIDKDDTPSPPSQPSDRLREYLSPASPLSSSLRMAVVEDTPVDERVADLRAELAVLKREVKRRDATIREGVAKAQQAAVEHDVAMASVSRQLKAAQDDVSALSKSLAESQQELVQTQRKLREREAAEAAMARSILSRSEIANQSLNVEQLQRRIEYLTSELEKERRVAVSRAVHRRVHGMIDAQTQSGSGVTVVVSGGGRHGSYRGDATTTTTRDAAVSCDLLLPEEEATSTRREHSSVLIPADLHDALNKLWESLHLSLVAERGTTAAAPHVLHTSRATDALLQLTARGSTPPPPPPLAAPQSAVTDRTLPPLLRTSGAAGTSPKQPPGTAATASAVASKSLRPFDR